MTARTNKPTAPPPVPLPKHNPPQTGTGVGGNTRDWAQVRDLHLPLWCRRLGPLRRLAEEAAAGAFRRTQDPMKVQKTRFGLWWCGSLCVLGGGGVMYMGASFRGGTSHRPVHPPHPPSTPHHATHPKLNQPGRPPVPGGGEAVHAGQPRQDGAGREEGAGAAHAARHGHGAGAAGEWLF